MKFKSLLASLVLLSSTAYAESLPTFSYDPVFNEGHYHDTAGNIYSLIKANDSGEFSYKIDTIVGKYNLTSEIFTKPSISTASVMFSCPGDRLAIFGIATATNPLDSSDRKQFVVSTTRNAFSNKDININLYNLDSNEVDCTVLSKFTITPY